MNAITNRDRSCTFENIDPAGHVATLFAAGRITRGQKLPRGIVVSNLKAFLANASTAPLNEFFYEIGVIPFDLNMVRFRGPRIGVHQATCIARDDLACLCRARWEPNGEFVRTAKIAGNRSHLLEIRLLKKDRSTRRQFNAVRSARQESRTPRSNV